MKERLLAMLKTNVHNITEAVIIEALKVEESHEFLLQINEWLPIKALNTEYKIITFTDNHCWEIETVKLKLQQYWDKIVIPAWYSDEEFYAKEAFKFVAFDVYMTLVIGDL